MKNSIKIKIIVAIITLAILLTSICYSYASSQKKITNYVSDNTVSVDEYQDSVSTQITITEVITVNDS